MCVGSNKQSIIIFFSPSASASHAMVFLGRRKREEQACSFSHILRGKKRVLLTNHARTKQEAGKEEEDGAAYKSRKQINQHGRGVEFSNFYSNYFWSSSCYGNLFVLARSYKKAELGYISRIHLVHSLYPPPHMSLWQTAPAAGVEKREKEVPGKCRVFHEQRKTRKKFFFPFGKAHGMSQCTLAIACRVHFENFREKRARARWDRREINFPSPLFLNERRRGKFATFQAHPRQNREWESFPLSAFNQGQKKEKVSRRGGGSFAKSCNFTSAMQ